MNSRDVSGNLSLPQNSTEGREIRNHLLQSEEDKKHFSTRWQQYALDAGDRCGRTFGGFPLIR